MHLHQCNNIHRLLFCDFNASIVLEKQVTSDLVFTYDLILIQSQQLFRAFTWIRLLQYKY